MKRLCQTTETTEFDTPAGGTLVYGPCKKHGYFMAMIHCPTADVKLLAQALLEAAKVAEAHTGDERTKDAHKVKE